ncbi:MAG TPA: hypothetical protein VGD98_03305 [Ktedonobacteraceae bacterium]
MARLRTPFLLAAVVLSFIIIFFEIGTALPGVLANSSIPITSYPTTVANAAASLNKTQPGAIEQLDKQQHPSGLGIPDMALLDSVLLFTVALMVIALILPTRLHGKVQGIATLIFSLLLIILAIVRITIAIGALILMISLLLAIPFGTIVYLILYGSFNRPGADIALSLLMLLKFGFAISLFFAHQRFFQNKGLVLLILTSLLCNVIVSFLLGFVPGFLVSITDTIAAIVVSIIAVVWGSALVINSIISLVKIVRIRTPSPVRDR